MSYEDYENLTKHKEAGPEVGQGQGQGKPRQGKGGFNQCTCPSCGYTETHQRGEPCNASNCPNCGTPLIGKSQ